MEQKDGSALHMQLRSNKVSASGYYPSYTVVWSVISVKVRGVRILGAY